MDSSNIQLDKYLHETHAYINQLSDDLGHSEEKQRVMIVWRAVMHTVRDRITISESLDLLSALPLLLKGWYVTGWSYSEKPPLDYQSVEQMKTLVKAHQNQYGEDEFDWKIPTEEIISITLKSLDRYFSEGQMSHIRGQLPPEIKQIVAEAE